MHTSNSSLDILFVSIYSANYSRAESLLTSDQREDQFLTTGKISIKTTFTILKEIKKQNPKQVVVCSPSHILVPVLKTIRGKSLVLDAGWPLSDANFTRARNGISLFQALKNFIVDFLAFQAASKVIVESEPQKERCKRVFRVPANKIRVVYTGVDEKRFQNKDEEMPLETPKLVEPVIFFRGKYNFESGLTNLLKAAFSLEGLAHIVIATDSSFEDKKIAGNVTLLNRKLLDAEIMYLYKQAYISIGQLSNHKRTKVTIPHKFFESAYFGIPYVTMEESAVSDLTGGSGIYNLSNSQIADLPNFLYNIIRNGTERNSKANEIKLFYRKKLSQEKLQSDFHSTLMK